MWASANTRVRLAVALLLVLSGAASPACSRDRSPSSRPPRPVLQPLSLPDVSNAAEPVQRQIRERHSTLQQRLAHSGASPGDLAAAYGQLGKILTAAEYLDAAEVCFTNAQALAPDEMQWPYLLGHVFRFKNDVARAARSFEDARALAPDHVPTLVWLAEMYLAEGQPERAEPPLVHARAAAGASGPVLYGLGRVALAKKSYAAAVEHLESALAVAPQATRIHYPLGLAYRGLGNRDKADTHLRARGEADVAIDDPLLDDLLGVVQNDAFEARGIKALEAGHWREAAGDLRTAVERDPRNAFTRLNLGTALYMLGDAENALVQYREAIRLSPGQAKAQFGVGIIMEGRGQDAVAIDAFSAAVDADPDYVEARFSLANALRRSGHVRESLAHYDEVLRSNPAVSQASFGYAMGLVRLGRHQEARDRLERDVKAFPDQPGFVHALARLLAASPDDRVRDGVRASTLARRLLDAQRTPALAETLAMALAEQGRFDEAVRWQREAIELTHVSGRGASVPRQLEENLRLYEHRQPCRVPWTDDDPVHHPVPAR